MKELSVPITMSAIQCCLICTLFISNSFVYGQINPFRVGARAWGVAHATVANTDASAAFNNIAGLAGQSQLTFLTSYDTFFQVSGINTLALGVVMPIKSDFVSGATIQRYGDSYLNEIVTGIGVGHVLDRFSLGLKLNYLQIAMNSPSFIASRKSYSLELGGIVKLTSKFSVGAHMYNLTQSKYTDWAGRRVPTILRLGILYSPVRLVNWSAEIEKNTDLPLKIKSGLSYEVFKQIWLRTGLMTKPSTIHFGFGLEKKKVGFDYAGHIHPNLGWSHHFTLAYGIKMNRDLE